MRRRRGVAWGLLWLGLLWPAATLANPAGGTGGLQDLLARRPTPDAGGDLRPWLAGEYDYVRTYRLLDRAYARLRQGDRAGAAADFEALLALHPDHPQLPLYLAELQLQRGDTQRAQELLAAYLERHPDNGAAAATLGYLYLDQGRREPAAVYLEKALAAYGPGPAATGVRANLAELAYAEGDYPRALTLYQELRPALPGEPLLAYRIGLTQRHLGHAAAAAASFQTALVTPGLDGDTRVRAQLERAQALVDSGDPAAGAGVLAALLADGRGTDAELLAQARRQLYVLSLETGACNQAVQLYPQLAGVALSPQARAAAGYCQLRLGHPEEAEPIFQQVWAAGDLAPATAGRMRLDLAARYAQEGAQERAARVLEPWLATQGVSTKLARRGTLELAEIRVAQGRAAAARPLLDALAPVTVDAYTALRVAQLYQDLGLSAVANNYLAHLAERPDVAPGLRARAGQELAFALLRRGDDAGAAAVLERLVAESDLGAEQRAAVLRTLAETVARTGPATAARRWAREAWRASPDAALGLLLARLERQLGDLAAEEQVLSAVRHAPATAEVLRRRATLELGTLFLEQGRITEAEEAFWRVLDTDPRNPYALGSLMELAKRRGDGEDFLVLAEHLRQVDRAAVAKAEMAATAEELGEYRQALELYSALLDDTQDPQERADVLRHLGFTALKLGDRAGAIGYLQRLVELAPRPDPQILEQLAELQIYGGDCAAALEPLRALGRLRQEAGDSLQTARCEEQLGDFDAAAAAYRQALDLSYDPATALALAWVQQRQGRWAAAVETLEQLAAQPPPVPAGLRFEALAALIVLYGDRGEDALRTDAARRAVAVLPRDADPGQALYALVLGGRDDPRLQVYEEQVRGQPDAASRQSQALRLSVLYEAAGDPGRALDWAAVGVAAKPTALARYRRGVLLYQAGQPAAARGDFEAALETQPEAALYRAYVLAALDQRGLAIDGLEQALQRPGNPADLVARMRRQLAHLYLAEDRPEAALTASDSAGPEDAELWQLRASSLLRLGQGEAALAAAERALALATPEQRPTLHRLLGDSYRQLQRWPEAAQEYSRALLGHPDDAAVLHAAADCRQRSGDPDGSRELLRRAVAADPAQPRYHLDYGYALARAGEEAAAQEQFDAYLAAAPEAAEVWEESGYLNLSAGHNAAAAAQFRTAIDQLRLRGADAADAPEAPHIDALRRTVWDLEKRFSATCYLLRSDLGGSGSRANYRGIVPGQLGLEGGWRPPGIGFRNHRIFEAAVRVLGSFEPESWSYDPDSTQLALGAKVKPFAAVNFALSLERLLAIGDNSEDNWLLRGMVSQSWGRQLRFAPGWEHAGSVYGELGRYWQDPRRTVAYAEVRDGLRWVLSPRWALLPHGVIDVRGDNAAAPGGIFGEGGVGLELLGGWGATPQRANPWSLSAFVQYKVGIFSERPHGENGKGYRGAVLGLTVSR